MLAFFAGANNDIAAPPWTQWTNPTLIFQQPILTFTALFARMATWPLNLAQVKFPVYQPFRPYGILVQDLCGVFLPLLWMLSKLKGECQLQNIPQTYAIVTPDRPLQPVENTCTHKPRPIRQTQVVRVAEIEAMKEEE
ncbi:hypothetical protein FIBSPDRAFT_886305 [Athelia psychrophila]|uniref:Uncharacterized protein n=1 Tax=Athelia psychrophila TaxID=1759441 RepID=A0A166R000_9AGAM|nr:hypothetical protein FIBSPDRAFT_886305 [Fibularhizoctonia sp. CBS 109695]